MPSMAELAAALVARQEMPPEKGDLGLTGERGPIGPKGDQGATGDPGRQGDRGDRGQDGIGADGRDGSDGKDGTNGEPGLVWRGPWVRNLQYWGDDAVEQDGSSYVCTVATRSKPPSGAWDLLAKRGATGPPGMSRGGGGGGGGSSLTVKDEGTILDTAAASIDFVGDGVTATAAGHSLTVTIPGGGGGDAIVSEDPPSNGVNAGYTVDYQGATGGGATWVVNGFTTASIAFDEDAGDVQAILEAADPSLVGLVSVAAGPPWAVGFAASVAPVTLEIGTDSLTGGGPALVTGDGGTAPDLAPTGTRWVRAGGEIEATYTQYGAPEAPDWQQMGDVTYLLTHDISGDDEFLIGNIIALTVTSLADGGGGILTDEYNVSPQGGGSAGAAIVSGTTDPNASSVPEIAIYTPGTLYLRNPDDVAGGELWLKLTTAGDYARIGTQAAFVPDPATPEQLRDAFVAVGLMAAS